MIINGHVLREARRRRGMSRELLAQRAKITARQIARYERVEISSAVRESSATALATALETSVEVLAGDHPLPPIAPTEPSPERVSFTATMSSSSRLWLDLAEQRYGVSRVEMLDIMPLLFTLLAEASLKWRMDELEKLEDLTDQVMAMGHVRHLAFAHAAYRVQDAAEAERRSIKNADLFGENLDEDAYQFGYRPSQGSPFVAFLAQLASTLDKGVVEILGPDERSDGRFPDYTVWDAKLRELHADSEWGRTVLTMGFARLGDIPGNLLADGQTSARADWLDQHMPPDLAKLLTDIMGTLQNAP